MEKGIFLKGGKHLCIYKCQLERTNCEAKWQLQKRGNP